MFGKPITLFKLFGFAVRMDFSWFIIAALITWSLAVGVFPNYFPHLDQFTYWWMGVAGALGLFASIVVHELSHSLVARRSGLPMKGITLFIFGGVAEMSEEPPNAKAEFTMAIAGPLASIVIGVAMLGVFAWGRSAAWPAPALGIVGYLGWINLVLAAFNLVPAFPLDGGRVLRSFLWWSKGDIHWATRVASGIGSGFGILLVVLGAWEFLRGSLVGGIWWVLIGLFLRSASQGSYQQLITRDVLAGEPVRRFMQEEPVTVSPSISLESLVEDYIYKHHFKMFPVVRGGRLEGCVTTRDVKGVPRDEWAGTSVQAVTEPCSDENTIAAEADSLQAFTLMARTGRSRLIVRDGDRIAGVIALKDLMQFMALKLDLEKGNHRRLMGI